MYSNAIWKQILTNSCKVFCQSQTKCNIPRWHQKIFMHFTIFRRKKFEYLNVCLKAIKFSNECGYFSNFLRERSRWKIWLCRKSVAKKLHSLKKRLKTRLLKKFSWKQARKGFRTIRARRYFGYIQTFSVIF